MVGCVRAVGSGAQTSSCHRYRGGASGKAAQSAGREERTKEDYNGCRDRTSSVCPRFDRSWISKSRNSERKGGGGATGWNCGYFPKSVGYSRSDGVGGGSDRVDPADRSARTGGGGGSWRSHHFPWPSEGSAVSIRALGLSGCRLGKTMLRGVGGGR